MDYDDEEGYDLEEEVEGGEDGYWKHANPPRKLQNLRACIACLLIKTYQQFVTEGCDNCEKGDFSMKDDEVKVNDCTTIAFEGMMALTVPQKSWVARWQFADNLVPGIYALKVKGEVSEETARELQEAGIRNLGRLMQTEELKISSSAKKAA